MQTRPSVSVIVPFAGAQEELEALVRVLAGLARAPGDEILIADNRPEAVAPAAIDGVRWIDASGPATPYFARNRAAEEAAGEWLVFLDADTAPQPDLLDRLFQPAPGERTAVLAGAIRDVAASETWCARYVSARRKMEQSAALSNPAGPYAQTANCAVRSDAFHAVGGFEAFVRSGGDADLCWRLAAAGWGLEERPAAVVSHRNRERFRDLWRQLARHGAGMAWLEERYPGAAPRPGVLAFARTSAHFLRSAARAALHGDGPETVFALADLAGMWARDAGRHSSNTAPGAFPIPLRSGS